MWFRVRNLGLSPAFAVTVEVAVRQPATVATICETVPGPRQVIGTRTIPSLTSGQEYRNFVLWHPTSTKAAVIEVRILPLGGELNPANNESRETVKLYFPARRRRSAGWARAPTSPVCSTLRMQTLAWRSITALRRAGASSASRPPTVAGGIGTTSWWTA